MSVAEVQRRLARIRVPELLHREQREFLVLTLAIGALVGLVIVAFLLLTERLGLRMYPAGGAAWRRLVVPLVGSVVTGYLLHRFFPEARGSGIPQTKMALSARGGVISFRTVAGKFLCCSGSLASGIALGREGPSVQIGAGVASVIGQRLKLGTRTVQSLIPVGSSAALAAAFNTPIAAVLFTLEEVVGDMHARVLGSVVLGAATSWVVLHLFLGNEPLFHVPPYQLRNNWEFAIYALLGVLGGLVSAAFVKLLLWLRSLLRRLPAWSAPYRPGLGGLFVGLLALLLPDVLGVGYTVVGRALNGEMVARTMLLLLALKLAATAMSYASGNAGGIFGPSLFLGAMVGGAVGDLARLWLPGLTGPAGAYALVGMGTAFAGIIRAPFTSVIMIFELTRDYNIIVPLMISNLISLFISSRLQRMQVYLALAEQDGVHLPGPETVGEVKLLTVADAMRAPHPTFPPEMTVAEFRRLNPEGGCVVAAAGRLWGVVSATQADRAVDQGQGGQPLSALLPMPPGPGEHLAAKVFPHIHPDHPLDLALHRMGVSGIEIIPVVDRTDLRRLLGVIGVRDLLRAYRVTATPEE